MTIMSDPTKIEVAPFLLGLPVILSDAVGDKIVMVSSKTMREVQLKLEMEMFRLFGRPAVGDEARRQEQIACEKFMGGSGDHWPGCETLHWDCRIQQLQKIIERLIAAGNLLADEHRDKCERLDVMWGPDGKGSPGLIQWDAERQMAENEI